MSKREILLLLFVIFIMYILCEYKINKIEASSPETVTKCKGDYVVTLFSGGKEVKKYWVDDTYLNPERDPTEWLVFEDSYGSIVRMKGTIEVTTTISPSCNE